MDVAPQGGPTGKEWLRFHNRKAEVHRLYPTVWSIPLRRKRASLLQGLIGPRARVLDFGAGGRSWEPRVLQAAPDVEYRSLDRDRDNPHDYYSLEEVEGTFDLILLIEVLEHLTFEEAVPLLARLHGLLKPGGVLLLTTPNAAHPTQYWKDPTHRTAWAHEFLGAVLLDVGFAGIRCFRVHHAKIPRFLAARAMGWILLKWMGVDFAGTIAVAATRGPADSRVPKNPG